MNSQQNSQHHFREILERFDTAMLVTRGPDGELRARPMAIAQIESDSDVWFVTGRHSGKIDELRFDNDVCLTFQGGNTFLSLTGRAELVDDPEKVAEVWQEQWTAWFPGGKSDPEAVLIKVVSTIGEYWDRGGANRLKYLFEAGKAYVSGTTPDIGSEMHEKVRL